MGVVPALRAGACVGLAPLEAFDRNGADLVLLDLMLPGPAGTEVCRSLRQRSDVPVIMLTAKDTGLDRAVGLGLGADDYVTKPFSLAQASDADPGRAPPLAAAHGGSRAAVSGTAAHVRHSMARWLIPGTVNSAAPRLCRAASTPGSAHPPAGPRGTTSM